MKSNPDQPFIIDSAGHTRFKSNAIVEFLLDSFPEIMNTIVWKFEAGEFSVEDLEQFYQLTGYSWSGYNDLSRVRDQTIERLSISAASLNLKNEK